MPEENKCNIKQLEEYALLEVEKVTAELQTLIDTVSDAVSIHFEGSNVVTSVNLTAFELEALAMKIPAECSRLQGKLNQYNVHNAFRDLEFEAAFASELTALSGTKGTAKERELKAELMVADEKAKNLTNKLIIKGIQGYIDRADKTYEGIKKVMDYRSKEGFFDRKSGQFQV